MQMSEEMKETMARLIQIEVLAEKLSQLQF